MKLLSLLILITIVISNTCCSGGEDYVIEAYCAYNKAIHIDQHGRVNATLKPVIQNITMASNFDPVESGEFNITLYSKESQRFLCFNKKWKLVGMKNETDKCHFVEEFDTLGFSVFRSAVDRNYTVEFFRGHKDKSSRPVPPHLNGAKCLKNQIGTNRDRCNRFQKIKPNALSQHNFEHIRHQHHKQHNKRRNLNHRQITTLEEISNLNHNKNNKNYNNQLSKTKLTNHNGDLKKKDLKKENILLRHNYRQLHSHHRNHHRHYHSNKKLHNIQIQSDEPYRRENLDNKKGKSEILSQSSLSSPLNNYPQNEHDVLLINTSRVAVKTSVFRDSKRKFVKNKFSGHINSHFPTGYSNPNNNNSRISNNNKSISIGGNSFNSSTSRNRSNNRNSFSNNISNKSSNNSNNSRISNNTNDNQNSNINNKKNRKCFDCNHTLNFSTRNNFNNNNNKKKHNNNKNNGNSMILRNVNINRSNNDNINSMIVNKKQNNNNSSNNNNNNHNINSSKNNKDNKNNENFFLTYNANISITQNKFIKEIVKDDIKLLHNITKDVNCHKMIVYNSSCIKNSDTTKLDFDNLNKKRFIQTKINRYKVVFK